MTPRQLLTLTGPLNRPATRYVAASVVAFALDLVFALCLREFLGVPVSVAAAVSFIVIAVCIYFVHEYWTFARDGAGATPGRMGRNFLSQTAALATRITIIAILEKIHDPGTLMAAAYIITGAGCSLTVNFLLNRFWVFGERK